MLYLSGFGFFLELSLPSNKFILNAHESIMPYLRFMANLGEKYFLFKFHCEIEINLDQLQAS